MATSTIPAFKAALVARLQADASLTGVQVSYGMPYPPPGERETVLVLGTRADDPTGGSGGQRAAALGQLRREERYVLELVVSVLKPAQEDQQDVTERAFALAAAIEDSIRTWGTASPPFGGLIRWAQVTSVTHSEPANAQEREAAVGIDLACAARI